MNKGSVLEFPQTGGKELLTVGGDQCVCALGVGEAKILPSWQCAAVNDGVYERLRASKLKKGTEGVGAARSRDDP